ncbi:MAG: pyridoxal phosphate-dependent aminotransferase, partial [Candidatus Acidiferrales bacterium]
MPSSHVSRRDFSRTLGQSFALLLAAPHIPILAASQGKTSPDGMIHLNFNENPYGPSPKSLEALASCGAIASRYPFAVYDVMIDALARKHGVKAENIMLGCGSTEVLRVADAVFLGPGKNVVAAEPTFEAILDYAKVMQGQAVKIPLTSDYRHDLPRMADTCTSQTGVVYVCNPNNPTGTIVTHDELQSFIPRVMPQTLILVDEAYFDFV